MFSSDKWFGATSDFYPEKIGQSLRFEGSTTNLSRTFVTPTSTTKFMVAFWIKPCTSESNKGIVLSCGSNSSNYGLIHFSNTGFWHQRDTLKIFNILSGSSQFTIETDAFFRDATNFQHFCIAIDLTQTANANKVQIFVNGKKYTGAFLNNTRNFTDGDAGTTLGHFNTAIAHTIGDNSSIHSSGELSAYLSEFYILDGQSIYSDASGTPNSTFLNSDGDTLLTFCEQKNGVAVPKAYSGTFGNNGCRLTFEAVGTNTTAESTDNSDNMTNIGDDKSGQGHNFGISGLEANDVVPDSPTNNFALLNPLAKRNSSTVSQGNLRAQLTGGGDSCRTQSTFALTSGKWYFEVRQNSSNRFAMGVLDTNRFVPDESSNPDGGSSPFEWVYVTNDNAGSGARRNNATMTNGYGSTTASGEVVMVALDVDNGAIWFGKENGWFNNGTSDNSATVKAQIEAGTTTNSAYTSVTGSLTPVFIRQTSNNDLTVNFGQDDTFQTGSGAGETSAGNTDSNGKGSFLYAPPSGFFAICSSNLSDTTLSPNQSEQADDYFNTFLYTGTQATNRNLALNTFTPDWVWLKSRGSDNHVVVDSSRVTGTHLASDAVYPNVHTNEPDQEASDAHPKIIANGIQVSQGLYDNNGVNFVCWNWKANGGTTSSNTTGSISATVQASTDAGFSIVTWTGTGSAGTLGHSLGKVPKMIIIKNRDSTQNWVVYHASNTSEPATDYLHLNLQNATDDDAGFFNDTEPTTTVFSVGSQNNANKSNEKMIAYVFAEIEGFSKFGFYTGGGSFFPYVHCGFRPAWVMVKYSSGSGEDWIIWDNKRDTDNLVHNKLYANSAGSEITDTTNRMVDFTSNGFKHRVNHVSTNGSGGTYVYMAFAEQPFKFSNAR